MNKNPDGSIIFNDVINKNKLMYKLQNIVNEQNLYLSNLNVKNRMEKLENLKDELQKIYKDIIIGTSLESSVIEDTNFKYAQMSLSSNRRDGRNKNNKEDLDLSMYVKLASTVFGDENNIVRCELNREEEFPDVKTQKFALWSNKIAHYIEKDSLRYMTDFGYGLMNLNKNNISQKDKDRQKIAESKFISNMRRAYRKYVEEDKYKFAVDKVYQELNDEKKDINNTADQNIINLKKLMNSTGFSRSSNDKDAMKSFLHCMRDQHNKDIFFKLKTNLAKEVLLEIKELNGDNVLDAYYVDDYATKDNKGRNTIRFVSYNENEGNRYINNNDCYFVSRPWKESTKYEKADEILSRSRNSKNKYEYENIVNDIVNKECGKGKQMTKSELGALCNIISASVYHLPKEEIIDFCDKNGIQLRKYKNLTEKSVALSGVQAVDVGFGSKSNDKPFEELPRYKTLSKEAKVIEKRNDELTKRKLKAVKIKEKIKNGR